jgi:acyl carrier protein
MLETVASLERVKAAIHETVAGVMATRGLDPAGIADDAKLSDTLGLKSMDLAEIVLTLEDELETDPFQEIPITSIRTVGDLVTAYGVALGLVDRSAPGSQDMAAEMAAARERRAGRRR